MKIDDNLEANLHEQTRVRGGGGGRWGLWQPGDVCLMLLHLKLIFYRLI